MSRVARPVLVILGSTGTGKSRLACHLAQKFSGEVINADSMQVYRGLDIATNKVSAEELEACPHHLLGFVDPLSQFYDVHRFRRDALSVIDGIHARDRLPIVCGGTNFYIEALMWDFLLPASQPCSTDSSLARPDDSWTRVGQLTDDQRRDLHRRLTAIDPATAARFHWRDSRKIARYLQVHDLTGRTVSELFDEQHSGAQSQFGGSLRFSNSVGLLLQCDRDELVRRIDERVDRMMERGLLDELDDFHEKIGGLPKSADASFFICKDFLGFLANIGLKEFDAYLRMSKPLRNSDEGPVAIAEGVELLKQRTRRYANRQQRWVSNRFLKREPEQQLKIYSLDCSDVQAWSERVATPAEQVVLAFLSQSNDLSIRPLTNEESSVPHRRRHVIVNQCCDICPGRRSFIYEHEWQSHLKSKAHRYHQKNRTRHDLTGAVTCNPLEKSEKVDTVEVK